MSELSALAGSEGYEVYADDAQGVQPLERSPATQKRNARAFRQASQDAQTGQPKLTRIEVRHYWIRGMTGNYQ